MPHTKKRQTSKDDSDDPSSVDTSNSEEESEEESEDEVPTKKAKKGRQKKNSLSPKKSPQKKLTDQEIKQLVNDCVYYLLVVDRKYVIKKADINKHVLKENKSVFPQVILKAKEQLKRIFGIKIIELEEKKGHYFLVNCDKSMVITEWSKEQLPFQGLLFLILTVIWMKDGSLQEEQLWSILNHLDPKIDLETNKIHPLFGDLKKFVTSELVKQLYITYHKVHNDPPTYEFRWGPRANFEINKEEMLEAVCQAYGNKPDEWISQYKQIQDAKAQEES